MTNPISGLPRAADIAANAPAPSKTGNNGTSFLDTLHSAIDQVGQLQSDADAKVADMVGGNGQDVHSAMIAVEKANLAFELMVEVRNKIVSAYQEVSRIPF